MNWPPTEAGTGGAVRAPAGHRPRLTALAAMLAAGAVALAACGGGGSDPTSTGSGSSNFDKALNYSKCMRSHGVPDFPDPNSKGQFITQPGTPLPSEPQSVQRAAFQACQHLAPAGGPNSVTPAQKQQMQQQSLKFVRCMRAHGLPNMPDPGADGQVNLPQGVDFNSPQVKAAQRACQSLQPVPGGGQ